MKKNMLAVLILVLTLVNLSLTAFSVFIVVPNAKRVDNLITKVLSAIDLDLEAPVPSEAESEKFDIKDTETYNITEIKTNLKSETDENGKLKMRYAAINCSLIINKEHDDYEDLSPLIESYRTKIISMVQNRCSVLSAEDLKDPTIKAAVQNEILIQIQELFNSKFIVDFDMDVLAS